MGNTSLQTVQKCMGQCFREAILSAGDTWKCLTQIAGAYPLAVKKYQLCYSWLLIILFCPKLRYTVRGIKRKNTDSVQWNFQAGFWGRLGIWKLWLNHVSAINPFAMLLGGAVLGCSSSSPAIWGSWLCHSKPHSKWRIRFITEVKVLGDLCLVYAEKCRFTLSWISLFNKIDM